MPKDKTPQNPEPAEDALLELLDEDGELHLFEHLDTVEYQGVRYMALSRVGEEEEIESSSLLAIMRVEEEDGEDALVGIDPDDAEFDAVWPLFKDRLKEDYEILEDED